MVAERVINEVQGIVAAANDRGVKLAGYDTWTNISKYTAGVVVPPVGAHVVLGLDKAGYIRDISIEQAEQAPITSIGTAAAPEQAPATYAGCAPKDLQIARMNSLGHAMNLLTAGGAVPTLGDLVETAEFLTAWIVRP